MRKTDLGDVNSNNNFIYCLEKYLMANYLLSPDIKNIYSLRSKLWIEIYSMILRKQSKYRTRKRLKIKKK